MLCQVKPEIFVERLGKYKEVWTGVICFEIETSCEDCGSPPTCCFIRVVMILQIALPMYAVPAKQEAYPIRGVGDYLGLAA